MQKGQKAARSSASARRIESQAAQRIAIAATTAGKTVKASFAVGVFILGATHDHKVRRLLRGGFRGTRPTTENLNRQQRNPDTVGRIQIQSSPGN
jgi:hypothetical protein